MDEFQLEAVKIALDKLFNQSSSFSICTVDEVGKMIGVNPRMDPDYKALHLLHCVSYTEMSESMRQELPNKVMKVLSKRIDTDTMTRALAAVANGEIREEFPIEEYIPKVDTQRKKRLGRW